MKKLVFVLLLVWVGLAACSPNNVKSDAAIAQLMDSAQLQGSFALLERNR
jgi:thioredoxin-related protein